MPENLPVILVSASDVTNSSKVITEIVDNEVIDKQAPQEGRIWRLMNKYYHADVLVVSLVDGKAPCPLFDNVEAHIIYIADTEEGEHAVHLAERRRQIAAAGAARAHVRLLLTAGERVGPALDSWARHRAYEPVPLQERGDEPDAFGTERARAALHAHTWRGLRRVDGPQPAPPAVDDYDPDEADVERAESFAEALGALQGARGAALALDDAERRQRAERAVAAFCRALGADLSL